MHRMFVRSEHVDMEEDEIVEVEMPDSVLSNTPKEAASSTTPRPRRTLMVEL